MIIFCFFGSRHAVLLDRTRRNADSRGIFLERAEQNRICRYGTVITDLERTENLAPEPTVTLFPSVG